MNDSRLTIHAINVNSLVSLAKRHELSYHINQTAPDIVLVSESGLRNRHVFELRNYNCFRNDKTSSSRGTCVFIRNTLIASRYFPPFSTVGNDYTAVRLELGGVDVIVVSMYTGYRALDTADLDLFFSLQDDRTQVVIGGDLNAKHYDWGNNIPNRNGTRLRAWINLPVIADKVELVTPLGPTFVSHLGASTIDLFLINKTLIHNGHTVVTLPYPSDHLVVSLSFEFAVTRFAELPFFLDYSKVNWKRFQNHIARVISGINFDFTSILNNEQIDSVIDVLDYITKNAIHHHVMGRNLDAHTLIKLDRNILNLIAYKKQLIRSWHRNGRSDRLLKSLINRTTDLIKQLVAIARSKEYEQRAKRVIPGPNLFKEVNRFANIRKRVSAPLVHGATNLDDSNRRLLGHFVDVHNSSPAGRACARELADFNGSNPLTASDNIPNITIERVNDIIRKLKGKKSLGLFGLSNFLIKKTPLCYRRVLTLLFRSCLQNGYFPKAWKYAKVVPIPKSSGTCLECNDFRPIAILPAESKVFELFIKSIFLNFVSDHNLLSPFQFGFTPGRGTSQALTFVLEWVHYHGTRKRPTLIVSLDLRKAFDTVPISGIMHKLVSCGFGTCLSRILYSYLTDRRIGIGMPKDINSLSSVWAGVPQGSILGPHLFNFFINDVPASTLDNQVLIAYADDLLLLASDSDPDELVRQATQFLSRIHEYLNSQHMILNISKCEAMLVRESESLLPSKHPFKSNENIRLYIGGDRVVVKDSIRYLGVVLDKKLSPIPQTNAAITSANISMCKLKTIFYNKHILPRTKIVLYKQLVRPLLTYGFPGWCWISANQMRRLRACERKCLYRCLSFHEAYYIDNESGFIRRVNRRKLYRLAGNIERLDTFLLRCLLKVLGKIEYDPSPFLNRVTSESYLRHESLINWRHYKFKKFPPSLIWSLHLDGSLYGAHGGVVFFNRRYNCIDLALEPLIYDTL